VVIDCDEKTGKARDIERLMLSWIWRKKAGSPRS